MSIRSRPRLWPFALFLPVLLVLWVVALEVFMKPEALSPLSVTPLRRLLWWVVPPMAMVLSVFAFQWGRKEYRAWQEAKAIQAEQRAKNEREKAEAAAAQAARDHDRYCLEVYGVGLSVYWSVDDGLEQDKVWEALKTGDPHALIPPTDPKAYPWSKDEKSSTGGSSSYIAAIKQFPEKWEIPFLLGGPALHNGESQGSLKAGLAGARTGGGMHYHRFRTVSQTYDDNPDKLPCELFGLFEQYPALPAAAIAVEDEQYTRDEYRAIGTPPKLKNGYEVPVLTGSCAVILCGRRDRVDMLRPTATDIPIEDIQVKFESEPPPQGIELDPDHILSYDDAPPEPQQLDPYSHLRPFWEVQGGAPAAFKPSRFVKRPWSKEQLVEFDLLKIRARLHRPQAAEYVKNGKLLGSKGREEVFLETWRKALATLPEGEKPVRVIYDFGPKGAIHLAPLPLAIRAAGPDLDIMGKDGTDVTARLRDTGADGFYVALALGIIATEKEGGVSAVVNLRREDRATVIMVSPPTAEDKIRRKIHFHSKYLGSVEQE